MKKLIFVFILIMIVIPAISFAGEKVVQKREVIDAFNLIENIQHFIDTSREWKRVGVDEDGNKYVIEDMWRNPYYAGLLHLTTLLHDNEALKRHGILLKLTEINMGIYVLYDVIFDKGEDMKLRVELVASYQPCIEYLYNTLNAIELYLLGVRHPW